jgi:hypothetical protein
MQESTREIWAVEIHDLDERGVLAFDLTQLLDVLGPRAAALDWIVTAYDPVTSGDEEVEGFANTVYEARCATPRRGLRVSSGELYGLGSRALQTIDGQFIGVPPATQAAVLELIEPRAFPTSEAELAIKAVDSSFWIVITKSEADIEAIRARFHDVREADRTLELGYQIGP